MNARSRTRAASATLALLGVTLASAALAQRADDNVTTESDDAFGRTVGQESFGVYSVGDVRGFSPVEAGNVRIEGLYFDQQKDPTSRLVEGSAIRVGIAAQSYPFPSPTGIVDYELRRVGDQRLVSTVLSYGPFDGIGAEVDAQFPLARDRFGLAAGFGLYRDAFEWGAQSETVTFGIVPRWKPTENFELRPFASGIIFRGEESPPFMLTQASAVPPRIERERYFGQRWAENEGEIFNNGLIGEARFGAWIARLGVFHSVFSVGAEFADLYTDIDASGAANELVVAFPDSRFESTSGELRAERAFEAGPRRHILVFAVRGRDQQRRYGGEQLIDVGPVQLGVGRQIAEPQFAFGERSRDEVSQETAGVTYGLQWKERGEFSLGLQKTSYSKDGETPAGALPSSRAEPTLANATITVHASDRLAFYGGYTEGLEESPVAPDNAVNRNVAAPALLTEQYDAGVRVMLPRELRLVAGVFNVEKPYFDLDPAGVFSQLGTVQHRGVEMSLAGSPIRNLSVLAGTRFLDAEVTGPIVDAGLIGSRPVRSARNYSIASVDYVLDGTGVSLDTIVEGISSQVADTANTVEVPGRVVLHLGGRYRFELFGKPATLRAQLQNVFDKYGWNVVSGGAYLYNAPRRVSLYLAADL